MDLMKRRREMLAGIKSRLPKEYQEVEYVKALYESGKSYQTQCFVCTNLTFTGVTKIVCKFGVGAFSGNQQPMFIASHASGSTTPVSPYITVSQANGFSSISPKHYPGPFAGIIDTYTITSDGSIQNKYMRIGGWSDVQWTAEGMWYFVEVYDANGIVASFIPCYRKTDSKAGFYDIINNAFYSSDGQYDFVAGPKV